MTKDEQRFFNKFGITTNEELESLSKSEFSRIYRPMQFDDIVSRFMIIGKEIPAKISIKDIIGYDREHDGNIFSTLPNFFDSSGDGYHTRSIGLLDYSSDEIMQKLSPSLSSKTEAMQLQEIGKGKCYISNNGLHRFTVLKIHYAMEMIKAKGDIIKEKQLEEKYVVPCQITQLDYIKTYCNYILNTYSPDRTRVELDLDENYEFTGKSKVGINEKPCILTDEQLLFYTKQTLSNALQNKNVNLKLNETLTKNEGFANFFFETLLNKNPKNSM